MIKFYRAIYHYFDKLEDRMRGRLSRYPITYSLIAGTGIVLFWRGVWDTADELATFIPSHLAWIDGPLSILISVFMLLITGLFVSFFVSDQMILSGIKKEKKLIEKTEMEVGEEVSDIQKISRKIDNLGKEIEAIQKNETEKYNNPQQ